MDKAIKECKLVIGENKLRVSNPVLPRIKGLPKIHKPGNEMREIVSAERSPTHRLAKWLVEQFKSMGKQFNSKSVKNSKEFTQRLLSLGPIEEDETMVSFDVKALFPSIPVKEAINLTEGWLIQQHTEPQWRAKVKQFLRLTKLCMEENYFTFRGEFYKQLKGAPMGNRLSPFISEIFMAKLESDLISKGLLPRFWARYVDDVFAIVKTKDLDSTLTTLNGLHIDISFTYEVEKEGRLPFLDILLLRKQRTLEIEIYRKPTNTNRIIPRTSQHSYPHKMAAFNHMIHRMLTLPISPDGQKKETEHILEIARLNGYPKQMILNLINKRKRTLHRETLTSLTADQEPSKRIVFSFNRFSTSLQRKLSGYGLDIVYSSRNNQLGTLLGTTKDPIDKMEKSGIYKITCPHCSKIYIGQTKRNMETRLKEHLREAEIAKKKNSTEFRSKVAEHIVSEDHPISKNDITMVNNIHDTRKLDVAESIEIYKTPEVLLLNRDQGNGYSSLFGLIYKYRPHPPAVFSHTPTDGNFTCSTHNAPQIYGNYESTIVTTDQVNIKRTIRDYFCSRENTEEAYKS